jgi:hypothetical protein
MVGVRLIPEGSLMSVVAEDLFEAVRKGRSLLCFPSDTEGVAEDLALNARSSRIEPNFEVVSEVTLSGFALNARSSRIEPNLEGVSEVTLWGFALNALSSRIEPNLEGISEVVLSGFGLDILSSSEELSFDMPGKPRRAAKTSSPLLVSSLLFLKAAFPSPLSAVWRKYAGSLVPSDAAIWSREG